MVNNWTRDDLPGSKAVERGAEDNDVWITSYDAAFVLDTVVEHLNAHHPKPTPGLLSNAADCVLDAEDRAKSAKSDADRWRRAHEIVERERDQARRERDAAVRQGELKARTERELAEAAERDRDEWEGKYLDTDEALHQARAILHEACKVAQSYKVDAYQATERAKDAEIERDEWKARAEAAERDRDEWKARAEAVADVDPVEAKARELWEVVKPSAGATWSGTSDLAKAQFRKVAAHVLGQEASR